ncbi:MAG: hypothetical protein PWP04_848, partial [Candidatus Atribacteria bacterium]|nr:hypothetical protein [Candidatus Atribacteria bacterium]
MISLPQLRIKVKEDILFLVEIEKSGSPWDNPRIEKQHSIERSHP